MKRLLVIVAAMALLAMGGYFAVPSSPSVKGKPPCKHNCTTSTTTTTTTTTESTTTTPPPSSNMRIAVILVNFSDDIRQPWTPDYIASLFNGPLSPNVADFYAQSSFGQITAHADIFGWYVIAQPTTGCLLDPIQQQAEAAATADGADLASYTNKVYLFPYTSQCRFSGLAPMPGNRVWVNFDPAGCPGPGYVCQTFHTLPHELGHSFGLNHAGTMVCTDAAGNHVVLSNSCVTGELGDQFDGMGCCTPSLFSNVRRLQVGWLPLSREVTVTQTTTLTVTPASSPDSLVYRIPDGTGQYLYLENRAAAEPPTWPSAWANGNLLIRRAPDINPAASPQPMTYLLDGSPSDNDTIPNAKGLPVGQSFALPNAPVTVENVAFQGGNNTVQVTYNGPPGFVR